MIFLIAYLLVAAWFYFYSLGWKLRFKPVLIMPCLLWLPLWILLRALGESK